MAINIRKARISDVGDIFEIIRYYSKGGILLPRTFLDLYENIRDFLIALKEEVLVGCGALHIVWRDMAEIKSLAVKPEFRNQGIGKELVEKLIEEAYELGINQVFALTYSDSLEFFKKLQFQEIDKKILPHKVWQECVNCIKFPDCEEKAVMRRL